MSVYQRHPCTCNLFFGSRDSFLASLSSPCSLFQIVYPAMGLCNDFLVTFFFVYSLYYHMFETKYFVVFQAGLILRKDGEE